MNMRTLTKLATGMALGACLALSFGAASAQAAEQGKSKRFKLEECDANKDGQLSKAEFEAYVIQKSKERADKRFEAMDKNKDGYVSKEEMKADAKARKEARQKKQAAAQTSQTKSN